MSFRPYLFFGGNCRAAFTRYQEIFGGELVILTMGDVPGGEDVPPEQADMVIHAALKYGDEVLMASDDPTADDFGPVDGMMVAYSTPDVVEAGRVFELLADGGEIRQALTETFFSPAFGMCVDRFGTPWMISTDQPPETA